MRLHVHEWGDPAAPPLVCLHGVTGHGERFKRLAEEHWSKRFHVIAPDLRGHGRSEWEPPWTYPTLRRRPRRDHGCARYRRRRLGRPFVRRPARARARGRPSGACAPCSPARPGDPRPAAHRAPDRRERAAAEPVYASAEEYADRRGDGPTTPRELVLEDAELHCERLRDGRLRRRTCQPAMVSIYGEIASEPPPPETLRRADAADLRAGVRTRARRAARGVCRPRRGADGARACTW